MHTGGIVPENGTDEQLVGYRVHAYVVVRVPVQLAPGEASSPLDAIQKAQHKLGSAAHLQEDAEDAEEIVGYLVDEPNDPEHNESQFYCGDGITPSHCEEGSRCGSCQQILPKKDG